jgi:hypothetical protein
MIELTLATRNVFFSDGDYLHVDYYPANVGLSDAFAHGAELHITEGVTPEQAIADYQPIAAQSLWMAIEAQFPGRYAVAL